MTLFAPMEPILKVLDVVRFSVCSYELSGVVIGDITPCIDNFALLEGVMIMFIVERGPL